MMEGGQMLPPIEVKYSLADMFGVQFHSWRRFLRVFVIVELLWIALIVGVDALDGIPLGWSFAHLPRKLLGWGTLLIAAFWFGLCPFLALLRIRRVGVGGPNTFELTEKGSRIQTAKSDSLVYSNAIHRTAQNSQRLYMFLTTGTLVVPRRSFVSDQDYLKWVQETRRQAAAASASN